jgi:uncharacterized RDD family membrane protein YckC
VTTSAPPLAVLSPLAERKERREVITPEGVPISFELASVGDRAGALILDLVFQFIAILAVALIASLALGASFQRDSWLRPLVLIALFLLQNFYFAFFELRWQGWTPGKRVVGIRVIDSRGGPLEPSAILARNLMRELELWMPIRFLIGGRAMWPDAPGWAFIVASLWTLIFLLLPLFNRDRLRAGDLVGGTWVVMQPKPVLLPDLAATSEVARPGGFAGSTASNASAASGGATGRAGQTGSAGFALAPAAPFAFTEAQLGVYGEFELTVLEQALRGEPGPERTASLIAITNKIRAKLRYEPTVRAADVELFLNTYYTAVRAHLERRRLFGKRKADKYS